MLIVFFFFFLFFIFVDGESAKNTRVETIETWCEFAAPRRIPVALAALEYRYRARRLSALFFFRRRRERRPRDSVTHFYFSRDFRERLNGKECRNPRSSTCPRPAISGDLFGVRLKTELRSLCRRVRRSSPKDF